PLPDGSGMCNVAQVEDLEAERAPGAVAVAAAVLDPLRKSKRPVLARGGEPIAVLAPAFVLGPLADVHPGHPPVADKAGMSRVFHVDDLHTVGAAGLGAGIAVVHLAVEVGVLAPVVVV